MEIHKRHIFTDIDIESKVIRFGIISFWALFWLFNVIDKFVNNAGFLWAGKDRYAQFIEYFSSIGIENHKVAFGFLSFITVIEITAFTLLVIAFWYLVRSNTQRARAFFFWGTFTGLALFGFFSIGDQVFGDRHELLEHTTYWIALIISWGAYIYLPKGGSEK